MAYPSKSFQDTVKLWESLFQDFHREAEDGILRITGVVAKFQAVLEQKFPDFPQKHMIKKFALSRTCFRWSTFCLRFFSWLLNQVIYLMLRKDIVITS